MRHYLLYFFILLCVSTPVLAQEDARDLLREYYLETVDTDSMEDRVRAGLQEPRVKEFMLRLIDSIEDDTAMMVLNALRGKRSKEELIHDAQELLLSSRLAGSIIPHLQAAIRKRDEDPVLREVAIFWLGNLGRKARQSIPLLIETLHTDEDPRIRTAAAEVLGLIADEEDDRVAKALLKALKNERQAGEQSAWVRCAFALEDMDHVSLAIPEYRAALEVPQLRSAAMYHLGSIGAPAKAAIPELSKIAVNAQASGDRPTLDAAGKSMVQISIELEVDCSLKTPIELARNALSAESPGSTHVVALDKSLDQFNLKCQGKEKKLIFVKTLKKRPVLIFVALWLLCLPVSAAIWSFRPSWILPISRKLSPEFEVKPLKVPVKLPLHSFLFIGFFMFTKRVLDAWVRKHLMEHRESFARLDLVKDRSVYIGMLVEFNGEADLDLEPEHLREVFERPGFRVLIHGEGGAGKTSLACEIARWAMNGSLGHPMLPVIVQHGVYPGDEVKDAAQGALESLCGVPVDPDLYVHLLRKKRILVIVDGWTEGKAVRMRPGMPSFDINALIVTARKKSRLEGVSKDLLQPQRLDPAALVRFLGDYLRRRLEVVEAVQYMEAATELQRMVGESRVPILFAKLLAELFVAQKARDAPRSSPTNMPDLVLDYIGALNSNIQDGRMDVRDVHRSIKVLAWGCVKKNLSPTSLSLEDAVDLLGESCSEIISYLEERLQVVRLAQFSRDRMFFSLDPVAEYFAALYLIEKLIEGDVNWDEFKESLAKGSDFERTLASCLRKYLPNTALDDIADEISASTAT